MQTCSAGYKTAFMRQTCFTCHVTTEHAFLRPDWLSVAPPARSRLLDPSVEHGEQDVHPGVHRSPQEVRGVHPRRSVPPHQVLHRQRRGRRARQGLRMTCSRRSRRGRADVEEGGVRLHPRQETEGDSDPDFKI